MISRSNYVHMYMVRGIPQIIRQVKRQIIQSWLSTISTIEYFKDTSCRCVLIEKKTIINQSSSHFGIFRLFTFCYMVYARVYSSWYTTNYLTSQTSNDSILIEYDFNVLYFKDRSCRCVLIEKCNQSKHQSLEFFLFTFCFPLMTRFINTYMYT
jgi:hypothetical protein